MLVFTASNVLFPDGPSPGTIEVDSVTGKISSCRRDRAIRSNYPYLSEDEWFDAGDKWILPGLVDAHVHLNEPGRTEWEGFWTGTRAAASGGVTTVVDMPLNSIPPTTTVENFRIKQKAATGQCWTDIAFWGGIIPGNQGDLLPLVNEGVRGFKGFLIESGVPEFPCVAQSDVIKAMSVLQDSSSVLLFHAELEKDEHSKVNEVQQPDPTLYSTFLNSRPQQLEVDAIDMIIDTQRQHPSVRCHIVHLSAASALPAIRAARASGLNLTVETCFHYLGLNSENIPNGHAEFKCCPPIRDASNRDLLWAALLDGTIDCVVSDHSPCVAELKKVEDGDLMQAWGGISTLGLGLSVMWTEGNKKGIDIGVISRWMSENTAKHASLETSKGKLDVGYDADLIFWDPDAHFKVQKDHLRFKNKLSPYEGMELQGIVLSTFLRGKIIWDLEDGFDKLQPRGQLM